MIVNTEKWYWRPHRSQFGALLSDSQSEAVTASLVGPPQLTSGPALEAAFRSKIMTKRSYSVT